jgi:predicted metalloprotease
MQWEGRRESGNVQDRRSYGGTAMAIGGGGSIVALLLALLLGANPLEIFDPQPDGQAPKQQARRDLERDPLRRFVGVVLADTEDVWHKLFRDMGKRYREPKLVLFTRHTRSGCGAAGAEIGPFYCPEDETIYLDLDFFRELKARFGAPGDFAQAYVIAHEVGHHVQKLLGTMQQVQSQRRRLGESQYNKLSVRLELQADFYAGLWAYHAQQMAKILDPGDLEEAIGAARAIGDDRLQMRGKGYVVPDSFTHGTSAQRVRWFRRGFDTGDIKQGDTFKIADHEL